MALSRILSQYLPRASIRPAAALISHHRHRSNKSHQSQLMEVDLDATSSSQQPDSSEALAAEIINFGIKKLEEAIHSIIVHRATPYWLPFLPGYSYWVPPRATSVRNHPAGSMIEAIGKITSSDQRFKHELLSEDEQMSLTSSKGWPSSSFFIEVTSPIHPIPVVELQVKVQDNEDNVDDTSSKDEEG